MFKIIKEGHIYEIPNRSENGFIDGSVQTMTFIEVKDDAVNSVGVFSQDYMNPLANRIEWQTENTPYHNADIERHRKNALFFLQKSIDAMNMFTMERLADGAKLLGHIKNEKS
jgi:hypothetical protein